MAKGDKREKGIVLYYDYRQHLSLLSDEERGRLLMALLDYGEKGTEPELSGAALMAFSFIRLNIDRDAAKYAEICRKRAEAGKNGGRPKKEGSGDKNEAENQTEAKKANGFLENQSEAKKANINNKNKNKNKNKNNISPKGEINMPPDGGTSTAPPLTSGAPASAPYSDIVDLYHNLCTSYPKLRTVSIKRKQIMDERWEEYEGNLDTFRELFTMAEESPFLKGKNDRGWSADFNWLLDAENMTKVLEGNYSAKEQSGGSFDTREAFEAAVAKTWAEKSPAPTAADDEGIMARAEALKQQFAENS